MSRLMGEAVQKQDIDAMEKVMQKMRSQNPVTPRMRLLLGNALFWQGEFERALEEHRMADVGGTRAEAQFEMLIDLMALRRFSDAWSHWEQMPSSARKRFGAEFLRVDLELRRGKPEKGLSIIKKHFADSHSSMENIYASTFGGHGGLVANTRKRLESLPATQGSDPSTALALAESYMCPETSHGEGTPRRDALAEFQALKAKHPDACHIAGRTVAPSSSRRRSGSEVRRKCQHRTSREPARSSMLMLPIVPR